MGSLLLAPLGAAIALHLTGNPVSLPVLIGMLMLFGIVAKNSILLVDFAVEMMDHGMAKNEAIWEAGHKRAQPIVMTTVAMVAGMVPIAMSLSGDGSWRAPMGVTVIGGLIFSTLLTLLLVPAFFSIAIDIESWIGAQVRASWSTMASRTCRRRGAGPGGVTSAHAARLRWRDEQRPRPRRASTPPSPARRGMKAAATGLLVVMAGVFLVDARASSRAIRGSAGSRPSPKRRWSAGWPTGSRSPRCSATRSACRSRTPRSSRATRTASARRWPLSSRKISSSRRWSRGACGTSTLPARRAASSRRRRARERASARAPAGLIADLFESLDDERLGGLVKGAISTRLRNAEVAPLIGHALASAINEDRHVPMLEAAIRWIARALDANEDLIREMVKKRTNWVLKLAGIDAKLVGLDPRWPAQADRRHADRPRASGAGQDRAGAGRPRQRPPDQTRRPAPGSKR